MRSKRLDNYLIYSSVMAIFTESLVYNLGIDWRLYYLILAVNYIVLAIKPLKVPNYFVYLVGFFLLHGIFGILVFHVNPKYLIFQLLGISVAFIYYYNLFRQFDLLRLKNLYLQISFWVVIIGYVLYFYYRIIDPPSWGRYRLNSILTEPAHYIYIIIPAFYMFFREKQYFKALLTFISIILAESSLGFIGLGLVFLLPNINYKIIINGLILVPFLALSLKLLYDNNDYVKLRVDETNENFDVFRTRKFDEYTNLSSYSILSNAYVAYRNLSTSIVGSGLGSHGERYPKFRNELSIPPYLYILKLEDNNRYDANSLGLRIISDFGIFGIAALLLFLFYGFKYFQYNNEYAYICQAIYIYFVLIIIRSGHYFPPEIFFFLFLFIFSAKEIEKQRKWAISKKEHH